MALHAWLAREAAWICFQVGNHLWQATLFLLIAWAVASLLKRAPARWRHAVWFLALARFAVPSMLFVWLGQNAQFDLSWLAPFFAKVSSHSVAGLYPIVSQVRTAIPLEFATPITNFAMKVEHNEVYCFLILVWAIGFLFSSGRIFRGAFASYRAIEAGARVFTGREIEILRRAQAALSVDRKIRLVCSAAIRAPGMWGIWRPLMVLPQGLSADLDDDEFVALMMHEVVHVKRWDNFAGLFQTVVSCLLWFYPPVWLLGRRVLQERESVCDEEVLRTASSKAYVSGILKTVHFCLDSKMAAISSVTGSNLKRRIENMMSHPMQRRLTSWHRISLGVFTAILTLSFFTAAFHGNRVAMAQQQNMAPVLSGSVYDPSRAAIPGAIIIMSSYDGKTKEIVHAGRAGEYKFPLLPSGSYTIEAGKLGFRGHREKVVVGQANTPQRLDMTLEVGEVSEYIEVTGKSPRVTSPLPPGQRRRIRVGGNVQQANLIHQVRPIYPEAARQAGIEGTVSLEAVIGKDGAVMNHRVLNTLADPALVDAAVEAIRQWQYQPTLLNGEPIEVVTTITISFNLSEP